MVELYGVFLERVFGDMPEAFLGVDGLVTSAVDAAVDGAEHADGIVGVELQVGLERLSGYRSGHVEGGMTADLEVDGLVVGVLDMPDDADAVADELIADAEVEVEGIFLIGLLRVVHGEDHLIVAAGDDVEVGVAGEAVLLVVVFLAVDAEGVVPYAAHPREEDGRAASPVLGVALPQILMSLAVADAVELCSVLADLDSELVVFK